MGVHTEIIDAERGAQGVTWYRIRVNDNGQEWEVLRRYRQFDAIGLARESLPVKGTWSVQRWCSQFSRGEFLENRRRGLEKYLSRLTQGLSNLRRSGPLLHFLRCPDDVQPIKVSLWRYAPYEDAGRDSSQASREMSDQMRQIGAVRSLPLIDGPVCDECDAVEPGELLRVVEEREGKEDVICLRLADGRGWVFERTIGGDTVLQGGRKGHLP